MRNKLRESAHRFVERQSLRCHTSGLAQLRWPVRAGEREKSVIEEEGESAQENVKEKE